MANQHTLPEDPKIRFERFYEPCPTTGCWLWMGAQSAGYGKFRFDGKQIGAHRAAYLIFRGAILDGLTIDHICNTPLCVNPDHLQVATQRANILRGNGTTARNARKTACVRGHALPTRVDGERRICQACLALHRPRHEQREYSRERMRRQRAAFVAQGLTTNGLPRIYVVPKPYGR